MERRHIDDDTVVSTKLPHQRRYPQVLRTWLPSRGNALFTLLVVGLLVWAGNAGALTFGAPAASSASTSTIAYQGRLANASGTPLTGTYAMTFRLYNAATGSTPLWEEQWTGTNTVQVNNGLFSVMLGSLTPLPQSLMTSNSSLWLGIIVGTDTEMTPRVQLGSVPFAIQALTVPDGSVTTAKLADGAVTASKLASGAVVQPMEWSATEVNGSTNTRTATAMATLNVTVSVRSKIVLIASGSYTSVTADWTWFNIDKAGAQLIGQGLGSPVNMAESFNMMAVDDVMPGTYIYKAQIAPTGSDHLVNYNHMSFVAMAFPTP